MWKNNNILEELRLLAPTLAKIEKKEVFKTPSTFFETNVSAWQTSKETELSIQKKNAFKVPVNYLENFESNLQQTIASLNTDKVELSKKYKQTEVFSTPSNYFKQLEESILASIKEAEANEFTSELSKENNFKVPARYFETLESRIFEAIENENSEVLENAKANKNTFSLPENYFENFESRLKDKIASEENNDNRQKNAKVIQLNPNRATESENAPDSSNGSGFIRKIMPWATAVAAVLTLFVGLNMWFGNTQNSQQFAYDLSKEIKKVSEQDLRDYILDNADEFEEEVIFAAKGYYDDDYKWFNDKELKAIDKDILREYYEEDIL